MTRTTRMTVIKINAMTVPADSGDELARRFAARAGIVDDQDGFEGFELLKPTDERTTWLVVTRWRDEASFQAWLHSPAFGHGHPWAERGGGEAPAPVVVSTELWCYEVAGGSPGCAGGLSAHHRRARQPRPGPRAGPGGVTGQPFGSDVVAAVSRHMNDDHAADCLLICRTPGRPAGCHRRRDDRHGRHRHRVHCHGGRRRRDGTGAVQPPAVRARRGPARGRPDVPGRVCRRRRRTPARGAALTPAPRGPPAADTRLACIVNTGCEVRLARSARPSPSSPATDSRSDLLPSGLHGCPRVRSTGADQSAGVCCEQRGRCGWRSRSFSHVTEEGGCCPTSCSTRRRWGI